MTWSLYEGDRFLKPICFSNGKSQKQIVEEVLEAIKNGDKMIFIHGVCGTGKSAIALNIARKLGKTSIVVPGKSLQEQYKEDYEFNKYLIKDNKEKLKISVMTGRKNHKCKFLEEHSKVMNAFKPEINLNLHDIFAGKREELKKIKDRDTSADNNYLPCKIEIKEKNWKRIKPYIQQNNKVNIKDFQEIKDVKRASVAGACPYWSPVLPEEYELKNFDEKKKKSYLGLNNKKYIFYPGKPGCGFYEQFNAYADADVIVFNSLKYKLETMLNRKPATEVEIIDECDEFLDKFSNQKSINLDRLQNSLISASWVNEDINQFTEELNAIIQQFKRNEKVKKAIDREEIIPLKETGIYDLLKLFLKNPEFLLEIDEESYLLDVEETARMFDSFLEDSFITLNKKEEQLIVNIVTTNLAKRFKQIIEKNKVFVLMSGTLHSEKVLKDIFGLEKFKVIEAEIEQQGEIEVKKTGLEFDCKYSNFSSGKYSRADYIKSLSKCLEVAKKPILVHINSFVDMPTEIELKELGIKNIVSREEIINMQKDAGRLVNKFKKGEIDVLFSTKCARGIDFPGEQCNSIIFTKYPNPNVKDAFWKILNQTHPQHYWEFYRDKARRELWQKVYRGLRFKEDHVYVLSPDSRVLDAFNRN